ncbi:MAG: hypothetical protein IPM51_17045 [Sphingobacteriaceae bacterium]|nr:hypothetical protein [Sphingobacteriaceae bacterium]
MIRIASPQIIELNATAINNLTTDVERKNYVIDNTSFYIDDTRLRNIELRVRFENPAQRPDGLMIYYFQQLTSSQIQPFDLMLRHENPVVIRVEESDFWKHNPLYVDKIGFLVNRITHNCRITVEAFKIL